MNVRKKCPQCKNEMLISSPTCLYCGRPNKFVTKDYINKKWNENNPDYKNINRKYRKYIIYIGTIIILVIIIIFYFI